MVVSFEFVENRFEFFDCDVVAGQNSQHLDDQVLENNLGSKFKSERGVKSCFIFIYLHTWDRRLQARAERSR